MTKAFLTGLRHQETFQQLAERSALHVVEFAKETGYVPRVVASPQLRGVREVQSCSPPLRLPLECTTRFKATAPDEPLDVEEVYGEGRVPLDRVAPKPFFWSMSSFIHARWLQWPFRNHHQVSPPFRAHISVRSPGYKRILKMSRRDSVIDSRTMAVLWSNQAKSKKYSQGNPAGTQLPQSRLSPLPS